MTQLSPTGRFDTLLLATDGSEFSAGATLTALQMAQRCRQPLQVMTIVLTNPEYESLAPERVQAAEQAAWQILHQVQAQAQAAGVSCTPFLVHGTDPAAEIVQVAAQRQADVIIMGRRGKRQLARWRVGHATVQVVSQAECPVLVVPRHAQWPTQGILLATDGSRHSDAAAVTASRLAQLCQLPVTVVSVSKPSHSASRQAEAQAAVERVRSLLAQEGVQATAWVLEGSPEAQIVATAAAHRVDLIIVGSRGRNALERFLLGSVSERVMGLAECATWVQTG